MNIHPTVKMLSQPNGQRIAPPAKLPSQAGQLSHCFGSLESFEDLSRDLQKRSQTTHKRKHLTFKNKGFKRRNALRFLHNFFPNALTDTDLLDIFLSTMRKIRLRRHKLLSPLLQARSHRASQNYRRQSPHNQRVRPHATTSIRPSTRCQDLHSLPSPKHHLPVRKQPNKSQRRRRKERVEQPS